MGEASYQKYFNHHDYVGKKMLDSSSENSAFLRCYFSGNIFIYTNFKMTMW